MTEGLDFPIQVCYDAIVRVSNLFEVIGEWMAASFYDEFALHLSICIPEANYNNPLTV